MELLTYALPFRQSPGMLFNRSPHKRMIDQTLRMMKLLQVFLLAFAISASAGTITAQKVTISVNNAKLITVLKAIKKQTSFTYVAKEELLKNALPVTINVKDEELNNVLAVCFKNQPFKYSVEGKVVVIEPTLTGDLNSRPHPQAFKHDLSLTVPPIAGIVRSSDGQPIAGANITVKGTKRGSTTNADGNFTINANNNDILIISSIGYNQKEVKINGENIGEIYLIIANAELQEVVVNKGYYTQSKKFNTGNVSTVKAADIATQPVSNPLGALQGRVPGLYITQGSGVPGASFTVRLRGQNSIASGNDPLYIVDGVPYPSGRVSNPNEILDNGLTAANFINPSDIESIDILKDADATAIYGSRGANGVILITTKKGKAGKTKVDLNIYSGIASVSKKMNLLNTEQYLRMRNEAFKNDGVEPGPDQLDMTAWDTTRNTDWQQALIGGTARYNDIQLALSGGNNHTQFLVRGTFHKETTVFPGSSSDRKTGIYMNLNHTSEDHRFKSNFSVNYILNNNNLLSRDLTRDIFIAPVAPALYDSVGQLNWENSTWQNPLSILKTIYSVNVHNLIGNGNLSYELFPGLEIKTSFGYNILDAKDKLLNPISRLNPSTRPARRTGRAVFNANNTTTWIVEPQLSYRKQFGVHRFSFLVGSTFQQTIAEKNNISGSGITNDALIENIATYPTVTSLNNYSDYKYNAVFGRVSYDWKQQYLINLIGRRDGSSKFGPGRRFGNFGAIGLGWIFSEEKFFKNYFPNLSLGKLRGSYGIAGNDQTENYLFLDTYTGTTLPYGGVGGLFPTRLYNPNYGWETNKKWEGGLELGFFKDRVLFSASYYSNRSSNQLVGYPLPPTTGGGSVTANFPATVANYGLELELSTINIKRKNFSWSSSVNITLPKNKLLAYDNIEGSAYADTYIVGQSLFIQKVFKMTGVDPQTGLYTFFDYNKDGEISSPADRQIVKFVGQYFFGGVRNDFEYRSFSLSLFIQFVKQQSGNPIAYGSSPGYPSNQFIEGVEIEHWRKPGDITNIQKFTAGYDNEASLALSRYKSSDKSISDASFARLKNTSLSYLLPASFIRKLKMQSGRVYFQGQNLITVTGFKGLDPEQPYVQNLPSLKVIAAGIQVIF
jgi:TonB-dependent starch-binding outer membrane protein SusC